VQCSLAVGNEIIRRVSTDIEDKNVSVLSFREPIKGGNLLKEARLFINKNKSTEILFVQGIEYSLYDYEETKKRLGWSDEEIYSYTWKDVPDILININQQRERFRDSFKNVKFVFLLPLFALKYVISRAPDFFDWKSGKFEFPMSDEQIKEANSFFLEAAVIEQEKSIQKLENLRSRIIEIQSLLEEEKQTEDQILGLLSEQSRLLLQCGDYEAVIANSERLLQISPDDPEIWTQRGIALSRLDREEEAIDSLDKALALDQQNEVSWIEKGICLRFLDKATESLNAYGKAIEINPGNFQTWNYMGISYSILKDWQNAANCYEKALAIRNDFMPAYHNLGGVLVGIGKYQEALATYDSALKTDPKEYRILLDKAQILAKTGQSREAIEYYSKVIEIRPDYSTPWHNRALALAGIGFHEEAIRGYKKAVEICSLSEQNPYISYWCMASSLEKLERLDEAEIACKKSIELYSNEKWGAHFTLYRIYLKMQRYRDAYAQLAQGLENFRPTDPGWREWVGRRVAIELAQHRLSFLVPLWIKVLSVTGFRSR
jgi:tetratricopeptide (TPR) repeat protein